eukprot:s6109_g1.t1
MHVTCRMKRTERSSEKDQELHQGVLLIKLLFDVHIADTKWHAVRCLSSWRPTFFLSLVPVAMAGAARSQFGDGCVPELFGWLRIYDSHHTSLMLDLHDGPRHFLPLSQVDIELDYDGGWHTWAGKPRPLTTLSSEESLYYYS